MLNEQTYYRIRKPVIESLQKNESDRWVAGQEQLSAMAAAAPRKGPVIQRAKPLFSEDEADRIIALKVLKDVGVYKPEYVRPIGPQLSELVVETEQVH